MLVDRKVAIAYFIIQWQPGFYRNLEAFVHLLFLISCVAFLRLEFAYKSFVAPLLILWSPELRSCPLLSMPFSIYIELEARTLCPVCLPLLHLHYYHNPNDVGPTSSAICFLHSRIEHSLLSIKRTASMNNVRLYLDTYTQQ